LNLLHVFITGAGLALSAVIAMTIQKQQQQKQEKGVGGKEGEGEKQERENMRELVEETAAAPAICLPLPITAACPSDSTSLVASPLHLPACCVAISPMLDLRFREPDHQLLPSRDQLCANNGDKVTTDSTSTTSTTSTTSSSTGNTGDTSGVRVRVRGRYEEQYEASDCIQVVMR
jgi:hypothetical protein